MVKRVALCLFSLENPYFGSMTHPQNGRYHQIASSMPAFALAELAIADQKFTVFNDATAVPSDRVREKQR